MIVSLMVPIILSGGEGKRLWPVSRPELPKQFSNIFAEPLQKKTIKRLLPLSAPWVITTRNLKNLTQSLHRELGLPVENILLEPLARNTAAATALVCHHFMHMGRQNEVVGLFPADHLIEDNKRFLQICRFAETAAANEKVVTLGIKPTYPATGYGYIQTAETLEKSADLVLLKSSQFHEKPASDLAKQFIAKGNFFWNAGIFIFKVATMINLFRQHMPDLWKLVEQIEANQENLDDIYKRLPSQSLDYGIMEKAHNIACIPCDFTWSDVGSWDEVRKLKQALPDKSIFDEMQNNYIHLSDKKRCVVIGAENLIIVESGDGLLICRQGDSEKLKKALDSLPEGKHN